MADTKTTREVIIAKYSVRQDETYSGMNFDRKQNMAYELTDLDRANGDMTTKYGYSKANFDIADETIRNSKYTN